MSRAGDSGSSIDRAASVATRVAPWLWGGVVAWRLTLFYFGYAPGQMHRNHDGYTYVYRAIEFMDALAAGYWSPQWMTHFRGGLGSPYFGYYQPGFFYAVAAFGSVLPLTTAFAVTLWAFALVGYGGTFALVRGRFGTASGVLAGTMLLVATYVQAELYRRGDLSEFAGMMTLAATFSALVGWLEDGGWWRWGALAVGAAAVVVTHPVAGLLGYAWLGGTILVWGVSARSGGRPAAAGFALLVGIGLSAFYWLPLLLEWGYVRGDRVASGVFSVTRHFIEPLALLGLAESPLALPVALGTTTVSLVCLATATIAWRWRHLAASARRLVIVLWIPAIASTVLMTEVSRPVWTSLPLVALIQFPWRLFMVQAIALSALAGCLAGVPRVVPLVCAVGVAWMLAGSLPPWPKTFEHVETAAELEQMMVAPDGIGEWMPRTARAVAPPRQWREPTITAGTIEEFERRTGYLRVRLTAKGPAVVTLPHYYFPVGWQATVFGTPIRLKPAPDGLMTALVVGRCVLEARFYTTPARRTGLLVSGGTLALLVAGMVLARRLGG